MSSLRDPADVVCRGIALSLLGALVERHTALSADADSEALHDFRVALRRLRSWLRAFEPHLPAMPRKARSRLRRIARLSNASRDLQVEVGWLRARKSELSARQRHGQDWLVARLADRRSKEHARFQARLEKDMERIRAALETALQRTGQLADAPPAPPRDETPFGTVVARVVRDQTDRIRGRLETVQTPVDHRQAHRARIEGKRLRYVLEPIADVVDAEEALTRLKRLQDSLGALQDCQTLSAEISGALETAARERGRRLRKLVRDGELTDRRLRDEQRHDVEAGLLALARRVHERRQDAFSEVERRYLGPNVETLMSVIASIAERLERPAPAAPYLVATAGGTADASFSRRSSSASGAER